jgi:hypothetical protein
MLIAPFLLVATLAFACPQSPTPNDPPAEESPDAHTEEAPRRVETGSIDVVDGEMVLDAEFFRTLSDRERESYPERLRSMLGLSQEVYLFPDPEGRIRSLRWAGGDVGELRTRLEEVLRLEWNQRELEHAKLMRRTITLDFKGGSLGSYIDALVAHFGLPKPLFDPPELRSATMPAVQLNRLDLGSAFALPGSVTISDGSKSPLRVKTEWIGPGANFRGGTRSITEFPIEQFRESVCIIRRVDTAASADQSPNQRVVINLSISTDKDFGEQLNIIVAAMQVAVDLDGRSPTFKARFHEPSRLLIVQGTTDEIETAAQIVRAKHPQSRIEMPRQSAPEPAEQSKPPRSESSGRP